MANFTSFADLRAACLDLPAGDAAAAAAVARREAELTKPPRSLGRLEDMVAWLARWQGRQPAAARSRRHSGIRGKSRGDGAGRLGLSGRSHRPDGGELRRRRRRHQSARTDRAARACGSSRFRSSSRPPTSRCSRPWTMPHFWPRLPPATTRSLATPTSSASAKWASAIRRPRPPSRRLCSAAVARAGPAAAPASTIEASSASRR